MSEQNAAVETTATESTAVQPETTPAAAAPQQQSVDINDITKAAAEKAAEVASTKMAGVFQSMLEQNGVDKETAAKQTSDFMASQQSLEQRVKELEEKLTESDTKNLALSKNIPSEDVLFYLNAAQTYVDDSTDLSAALDKALEKVPIKKDVPELVVPTQTSTGSTPPPIDPIESKIRKRMGLPPEPRS